MPIDRGKNKFPIVYNYFVSENERRLIFPQMSSALSHTRLFNVDIFGELRSINNIQDHGLSVNDFNFVNDVEYNSRFCGTCVGSHAN